MRQKGEEAGVGWESCHRHAGLLWKRERERERWRLGSKCFRPWCSFMNISMNPAGLGPPRGIYYD